MTYLVEPPRAFDTIQLEGLREAFWVQGVVTNRTYSSKKLTVDERKITDLERVTSITLFVADYLPACTRTGSLTADMVRTRSGIRAMTRITRHAGGGPPTAFRTLVALPPWQVALLSGNHRMLADPSPPPSGRLYEFGVLLAQTLLAVQQMFG